MRSRAGTSSGTAVGAGGGAGGPGGGGTRPSCLMPPSCWAPAGGAQRPITTPHVTPPTSALTHVTPSPWRRTPAWLQVEQALAPDGRLQGGRCCARSRVHCTECLLATCPCDLLASQGRAAHSDMGGSRTLLCVKQGVQRRAHLRWRRRRRQPPRRAGGAGGACCPPPGGRPTVGGRAAGPPTATARLRSAPCAAAALRRHSHHSPPPPEITCGRQSMRGGVPAWHGVLQQPRPAWACCSGRPLRCPLHQLQRCPRSLMLWLA